jgi:hypothetical protein
MRCLIRSKSSKQYIDFTPPVRHGVGLVTRMFWVRAAIGMAKGQVHRACQLQPPLPLLIPPPLNLCTHNRKMVLFRF